MQASGRRASVAVKRWRVWQESHLPSSSPRFYEVKYPIEQKLYTMFLEHRMRSFQGAFHMNPDYQHWYGWAEMKRDLAKP